LTFSTRFTALVGCELPLQLAAMGGIGTIELAAAVARAGGLGMVADRGVAVAAGSCGANFLIPALPQIEEISHAARETGLVEFFYGDPDSALVKAVHAEGAIAGWQVGSASEATSAEDCGCDYVVVQGVEAGGHVRGTEPLEHVLARTRRAVSVPVVAAGGVATAERFAEVMRLGADGVRIGTRFVVCPESAAHPDYVDAILNATGDDATVLTEWFSDGWENAPHRVLRTALDAARQSGWREVQPPDRDVERNPHDMAMYAGTGAADIVSRKSAADTIADLVQHL
jgi:NAD(P)H-dependent flavin oxidoreductase YrpB (nitropropane dioxygenase family)